MNFVFERQSWLCMPRFFTPSYVLACRLSPAGLLPSFFFLVLTRTSRKDFWNGFRELALRMTFFAKTSKNFINNLLILLLILIKYTLIHGAIFVGNVDSGYAKTHPHAKRALDSALMEFVRVRNRKQQFV